MKIGVVSHMFPTRKNPVAGVFVKNQLDLLARQIEVKLFAPYPNQRWLERDTMSPPVDNLYPVRRPFVPAFPRFFMQQWYPESYAFVLRLHRGFFEGCDVIHAHNAFPDGAACVRAFVKEKPVVVTVHGSDVNVFALKRNLRTLIVDALSKCRRVICVSSALAVTLRDIGVTSPLEVIPNGVDTSIFTPGDKAEASRGLGLDPSQPRVIFIGNFNLNKGIDYLIKAMPLVHSTYPDCELVLLGARPGTGDLFVYHEAIRAAGIEKRVRIVTAVPHSELPQWLAASDALALPSILEGFGLVAAEALACGRPVVATRSGGPEDIVLEGQGALVPVRDYVALGEGIVRVFGGAGIIGAQALAASARERYSFDRVCERIIAIYNDAMRL